MANNALQTVLNLTDTWFLGRLSAQALAAVGAVHRLIAIIILLFGGVALAVQVVVAQSFGARRYLRASQAAWLGLWGALLVTPLLILVGLGGRSILQPFGLDEQLQQLGGQFWLPRVAGAPLGIAASALFGFFIGIGRPKVMLYIMFVMVVSNAALNQVLIFDFNLGVAGSALASTIAQAIALMLALCVFLSPSNRRDYRSHMTWRLDPSRWVRLLAIGLSSSLLIAADRVAMALFQLMQARLSSNAGAVTQISLTLSSIAYLPGVGIAMAGATLVGHAVGAGDLSGAKRVGDRTTTITVVFMGAIGLLIALSGPWLFPMFLDRTDPHASSVIASGVAILWLAVICQIVDAVYLSCSLCLRSAGDTTVPAALALALAWFVFIPMAHTFMFDPGEGLITAWPNFGWGLTGGWCALVIYCVLLSAAMFVRWRFKPWKRVTV